MRLRGSKSVTVLILLATVAGCAMEVDENGDDLGSDDVIDGPGSARQHIKADVDLGGGVLLANRPGGYYMGRMMVGWTFDRQDSWYYSKENRSNYAWAMAWGHSDACLWVGPSRGKIGFTAGTWATRSRSGPGQRCTDAQKRWLAASDGGNLGSHYNCPPPTSSAHGTEKVLLTDAPLYWNVTWRGGPMGYDGGALRDVAATIPAGTHVWYRYTTRDGRAIVAFVPGVGWGFFPIGVLDRSRTGFWSKPTDPAHKIRC